MKLIAQRVMRPVIGAALLCAVVAEGAGWKTAPIYDVLNAPVVAPRAASMDDVTKAIVRAGTQLGWQMTPEKLGHIVGRIALRAHTAVVDVTHDTRIFNIKYRTSTNLDQSGGQIHRNYNGWIKNLEKGIRAQLANL